MYKSIPLLALAALASALPTSLDARDSGSSYPDASYCPSIGSASDTQKYTSGQCFHSNINQTPSYNIPTNNLANVGQFGKAPWSDVNKAWTGYLSSRPHAAAQVCAAPKGCTTVSSSGKAVFVMCNDNGVGKCVNAQDVADRMTYTFSNNVGSSKNDFNGQCFFGDGTNVIVKHS